jgi:hypothetical protein
MSSYKPKNKFRVIVLDECHKITDAAINALLKPLEEPPEQTLWILCTNLPEKIPNSKAVIGRCLKLSLNHLTINDIVDRLMFIKTKEKIAFLNNDISVKIAEAANGQMRDALQILDSLIFLVGSKTKLTDSKLIQVIDTALNTTINTDLDTQSLNAMIGIYGNSPKLVVKAIFDCTDHIGLLNRMLWINQFLIGKFTLQKHPKIWYNKVNNAMLSFLSKHKITPKIEDMTYLHSVLSTLRGTNFSVPLEHDMMRLINVFE